MTLLYVGQPVSRIDGRQKVTGTARYAAENDPRDVAHGAIVHGTIACGRIVSIDASAGESAPGVLAVLTHLNAPRLPYRSHRAGVDPELGEKLHVLQSDRVSHQGDPVAFVVARTLEEATHAATLVRVSYAPEAAITDFRAAEPELPPPEKTDEGEVQSAVTERGDPHGALAASDVEVEATYVVPREYHNPLELHATVAAWDGDRLTLWDKSQFVANTAAEIASVFGVPAESVRVISPFVGGAFGSALRAWPHVTLAALGARVTGRPVKVMLSRREMYYGTGYRPHTIQRLALGATRDGHLTAIVHDGWQETSTYEWYDESLMEPSQFLYSCPNVYTRRRASKMNVHTPTWMRAPGEASGAFALESAMDELAIALELDPVELRLRNEPERNEHTGLPFSSRSTRECFRVGAERFGWGRRSAEPRSMRDGRWLVGWGVATATYPTQRGTASARVRLLPDGTAEVTSAASDMGPGTWTSVTQVAADALGLPIECVRFTLGDSAMPRAPAHGGSQTLASVGSAVQAACRKVREEALALGGLQASVAHAASDAVADPDRGTTGQPGSIEGGPPPDSAGRGDELRAALRRLGRSVEATVTLAPGDERKRFAMHAFGGVFVEVAVDRDLGETRVRRIVGAYGLGRIVNPKTTRSQIIGGMIGGLGMALLEHGVVDPRNGRVPNANLAEYAVPVHADSPPVMDVVFVEEHDPHVNPLGSKGVGEIAIVGVAAAIANAIHHATGKRVRELPITPDKLL